LSDPPEPILAEATVSQGLLHGPVALICRFTLIAVAQRWQTNSRNRPQAAGDDFLIE